MEPEPYFTEDRVALLQCALLFVILTSCVWYAYYIIKMSAVLAEQEEGKVIDSDANTNNTSSTGIPVPGSRDVPVDVPTVPAGDPVVPTPQA